MRARQRFVKEREKDNHQPTKRPNHDFFPLQSSAKNDINQQNELQPENIAQRPQNIVK